jgi:EmrB/QacA subfamily drug resistance transporter
MRTIPRKWRVLCLVSVAVFMASLDLFIVNVALPDIQSGLGGLSLSSVSWVLNAYAIVFAALLVPAGRLADRLGRKAFFEWGLLVFTGASVLCAIAPSLHVLVGARLVQAAGAACLYPTSLALLLPEFEGKQRATAIAIYSGVGGISAALGPPIGGLLVEMSWRLIFLVNVPVGVATLLTGLRVLHESREGPKARIPDVAGGLLLAAGIAAGVGGIVEGQAWGWSSTRVLACFVGAAGLIAAFLWRSRRHAAPIVELPMLRVRSFAMASLAQVLFSAAFGSMLLSMVLFLTEEWHYSILRAGLAIAPGPTAAAVCSVPGGTLGQRIGQARVLAVSTAVFGAGFLWLAWQATASPAFLACFLPAVLVTGFGVGFTLPNIFTAGVAGLSPERYATGSAVLSMARQFGAALGVAIFVAVLGAPAASEVIPAFQRGWIVAAAMAGAAALVCLAMGVVSPVLSQRRDRAEIVAVGDSP